MCTILYHDNQEIETQGRLAELLGGSNKLVFNDKFSKVFASDCCLCPIDIEKTLQAGGYKMKLVAIMEFQIERIENDKF